MGTGKEIRRLRLKYRLSAERAAGLIGVDPSRLRKWEQKDLEPKADDAKKIETFFNCELGDLPKLDYANFFQFDANIDEPVARYERPSKTEVDPEREGIAFVPIAAQAGYAQRMLDPVYLNQLERVYLPGFPYRGPRYRIFEVEGKSMEPTFREGHYAVGEEVERGQWENIKEFHTYVVVTEDDVVIKRLAWSKKQADAWALISDNEEYSPYLIKLENVKALYFVRRKIDWDMSPPKRFDIEI